MPLVRLPEPFEHPEWVFELKYDGFRALAYVDGQCRLVSRNGNTFRRFGSLAAAIASSMSVACVLDGEVVCLDGQGLPRFNDLFKGGSEPHFVAFDILHLEERNLCGVPLLERKRILRSVIPVQPCRVMYAQHIECRGTELFRLVCDRDLEGMVAKRADGLYTPDASTWVKVKNRAYSQSEGRWERLQRRRPGQAG